MRTIIGILLLLGGLLWFLPILGLWMIPLGLLVLSVDFPWARRGYLSIIVWFRKMRDARRAKKRAKKQQRAAARSAHVQEGDASVEQQDKQQQEDSEK